ncbi:MAG: hypothetical protein WBP63_18615, partial [Silvibacterium sp.]
MEDRTNLVPDSSSKHHKRRWVRVLAWTGFIAFLVAAMAFTVFAIYFRRAEPILRKRVVETLATRYDS